LRVGGVEIVAWYNFLRSSRNGKAAAAAETNFEFDGLEGRIYVHDNPLTPATRNQLLPSSISAATGYRNYPKKNRKRKNAG
jgi:hypothetical protein